MQNPTLNRRALGALFASMSLPSLSTRAAAASVNIVLKAKPFAQTFDNSCWAAAAVILMRWKNPVSLSEAGVAAMAGPKFTKALQDDIGLLGSDLAEFAKALGLATEAPQSYTPAGYEKLLKAHGPLWVGADVGSPGKSRKHVRVLYGVSGDGTFDGTTAYVLDPDGGQDVQMTLAAFAQQIEQIAKDELDAGAPLSPQVIRFP